MPKLVKRSKNYAVEYFDPIKGFTTRQSLGTDDVVAATRKFAEWTLRNTHQRGSLDTVTIEGLLGTFYAQKAHEYASKYVYKSATEYASKYLRDLPLSEFRRNRQERFVRELREEGLKDGTVKRILAAIATSVQYAYEHDVIPEKPHILTVSDDATRDRVLTDGEARALIEASAGTLAGRYVTIALLTGARPSAIIGLSKAQFDFDHHLLRLLPPGERQVKQKPKPTIALPQTLELIAKGWNDGPVFQTDHIRYSHHRPLWDKVKSAVPADITPYTLRHTCATELRRQGVPEWDISGFLGHQGPGARTTGRYAHYRPDFMRAAADAMDRYWLRLMEVGCEGRDDVNGCSAGSERKGAETVGGTAQTLQ